MGCVILTRKLFNLPIRQSWRCICISVFFCFLGVFVGFFLFFFFFDAEKGRRSGSDAPDIGPILPSTAMLLEIEVPSRILWGSSDATVTGATMHSVAADPFFYSSICNRENAIKCYIQPVVMNQLKSVGVVYLSSTCNWSCLSYHSRERISTIFVDSWPKNILFNMEGNALKNCIRLYTLHMWIRWSYRYWKTKCGVKWDLMTWISQSCW